MVLQTYSKMSRYVDIKELRILIKSYSVMQPSKSILNINSHFAKVISSVNADRVFALVSKFGDHMKKVLIYDRIAEGIQDFCANNSIDEVYNSRFVELSTSVEMSLNASMTKLAENGLNILNLFIPKPDIPPAIAANYREVNIVKNIFFINDHEF